MKVLGVKVDASMGCFLTCLVTLALVIVLVVKMNDCGRESFNAHEGVTVPQSVVTEFTDRLTSLESRVAALENAGAGANASVNTGANASANMGQTM